MKKGALVFVCFVLLVGVSSAEIKAKKKINHNGQVVQMLSKYYNENLYYLASDSGEKFILLVDTEVSGPEFDRCVTKAFVKKKKINISGDAIRLDNNTEWELAGQYTTCRIVE